MLSRLSVGQMVFILLLVGIAVRYNVGLIAIISNLGPQLTNLMRAVSGQSQGQYNVRTVPYA